MDQSGPPVGTLPITPAKPHYLGSGATNSISLCWFTGGEVLHHLLAPEPQGFKGQGKSARYAWAPWEGMPTVLLA